MFTMLLALLAVEAPSHAPRHSRAIIPVTEESGREGRAFERWESGNWQVLAGPDYCAADFQAADMQFSLEKYWWTGGVRLQVMSRNWLSLASRTGRPASLRFDLDGYRAWATNVATVVGNGQIGGFFMDLSGDASARVPARVATANLISIFADGRTLGTYELRGASEAMDVLAACVGTMRASDHRDPFAPARR